MSVAAFDLIYMRGDIIAVIADRYFAPGESQIWNCKKQKKDCPWRYLTQLIASRTDAVDSSPKYLGSVF